MLTDADCKNATCLPDKVSRHPTVAGGSYLEVKP